MYAIGVYILFSKVAFTKMSSTRCKLKIRYRVINIRKNLFAQKSNWTPHAAENRGQKLPRDDKVAEPLSKLIYRQETKHVACQEDIHYQFAKQ